MFLFKTAETRAHSSEEGSKPKWVTQKKALELLTSSQDKKFLEKTRQLTLVGKKFIYAALSTMGLGFLPSVTNFILVDVGRDCLEVFKAMLKLGVIVRDMEQYGLANFIRVTIGTQKENQRFIRVLRKVLNTAR